MTTPSIDSLDESTDATSLLYYTRCPAPTATGVATGLSELAPALSAAGFRTQALQDVSDLELRKRHFDHGIENLVREGGNIPAIWAKSTGAPTRLVGITWLDEIQLLVVRADDARSSVEELSGARIAIPGSRTALIDVSTISAVRGFEQGLATAGLTLDDVTAVNIEPKTTAPGEHFDDELDALQAGEVDVVWIKGAAASAALAARPIRSLLRIDQLEDRLARVNNGTPRTLTFRQEFIDENIEAVRTYLDTVRGSVSSIGSHRARLWEVLASETHQSPADAESAFAVFDTDSLIPSLSSDRIAALQNQADFLFRHGYIPERVDVQDWSLQV